MNPNRDRQHGRIYRLLWEGAQNRPTIVSLASASPSALVSVLENDNMFWRLTAQRLLLEARATEVVELLRKKVAGESVASLHALWILHGLGKLDREIHQAALLSASPELRRNAIRALGNSGEDLQLLLDTAAITAEDLGVRRGLHQDGSLRYRCHLEDGDPCVFSRTRPTNRMNGWRLP